MMSTKMFRLFGLLLILAILLVACQPTAQPDAEVAEEAAPVEEGAAPAEEETPFTVGMVFATGGLGDKSFNDSGYNGAVMAQEELGITFDYVEPNEIAEYESHNRSFAQTGKYDLIVGLGFDQAESMATVAADFPDQKWLMIDGVIDGMDNVRSITFKDHEKAFLIGGFGALITTSDVLPNGNAECVLGAVGGMDIPLVNALVAGYSAGARLKNPDCQIITNYVGGWADPATGKEIALSMYDQGADIAFQFAGGSGLGVFEAAKEADLYAFGSDVNQNWMDPDHIVLSAQRYLDVIVFNTIKDMQGGTWEPGHHNLGLAAGAVGYTLDDSNIEVPQEIVDQIEDMKAKIVSGELVIPATVDQVDPFIKGLE
jgi:basic membrane protein A and related proteins